MLVEFLFILSGGLEVIVCFLVIVDSDFVWGWFVVVGFLFVTEFVVVWRFNVVDIVFDLGIDGFVCEVDFKEFCDDDFVILGGG